MRDVPLIALAQGSEIDVVPSDKQGYDPTFYDEYFDDAYRWNIVR